MSDFLRETKEAAAQASQADELIWDEQVAELADSMIETIRAGIIDASSGGKYSFAYDYPTSFEPAEHYEQSTEALSVATGYFRQQGFNASHSRTPTAQIGYSIGHEVLSEPGVKKGSIVALQLVHIEW